MAADITVADVQLAIDATFVLLCSFYVLFMICGFTLLESGLSRMQNVRSIILQNLTEACLTIAIWYFFGYGLAFGEHTFFGYVGYGYPALHGATWSVMVHYIFMTVFAQASVTIPSGAVAERVMFHGWSLWTVVFASLIVPPVYHMVWDARGFHRKLGCLDYAGGLPVHLTGGLGALMATAVIGPRIGSFTTDGRHVPIEGHSVADAAVSCLFLTFSWLSFNSSSGGKIVGGTAPQIAGLVVVNTMVAFSAATLFSLYWHKHFARRFDLDFTLNAGLSALVAITPTCAFVENWAAAMIGIFSVLVYAASTRFVLRMRIDDPVCATQVHFANGVFGVLANGIFASPLRVKAAMGAGDPAQGGLLYTGSLRQLGVQLFATLSVSAWVAGASLVLIYVLHSQGLVRFREREEKAGLDNCEQGGVIDDEELEALDRRARRADGGDNDDSDNSSQNLDNFDELTEIPDGDAEDESNPSSGSMHDNGSGDGQGIFSYGVRQQGDSHPTGLRKRS